VCVCICVRPPLLPQIGGYVFVGVLTVCASATAPSKRWVCVFVCVFICVRPPLLPHIGVCVFVFVFVCVCICVRPPLLPQIGGWVCLCACVCLHMREYASGLSCSTALTR